MQIPTPKLCLVMTCGLLMCTLISENQGLEKSRSVSNLRKISSPGNLDFFLGLHLEQKTRFKSEKNPGDKMKKKSRFAGPEIFLTFEADLDFSRTGYLEIKVQIERPNDISSMGR